MDLQHCVCNGDISAGFGIHLCVPKSAHTTTESEFHTKLARCLSQCTVWRVSRRKFVYFYSFNCACVSMFTQSGGCRDNDEWEFYANYSVDSMSTSIEIACFVCCWRFNWNFFPESCVWFRESKWNALSRIKNIDGGGDTKTNDIE